ncbi:glycosyltransferase 87 family protein [Candidatus Rhodoluna planktonica]|uniref:DUF2029 domain-containing protein n=1 Tax=Candidatus Rhodoluna planktonica TaxID=535712 RepID=A0A1D9DYD0_9MICO|nr:glycosyltransferase 87 family protein [Candidatus Rhodoluna planktonica]AOY55813.1 hypothetical protein A4Z71_02125 [Candidatus Rhodoluna planktonica]
MPGQTKKIWLEYLAIAALGILAHSIIYLQGLQNSAVSPMNDLILYQWWLQQALAGMGWYGITVEWVYPYLAIFPMLIAQGFSNGAGLLIGWIVLFSILHILTALALKYYFGKTGSRAAILWFGFLLVLGPVSLSRIDTAASLSALAGLMIWLRGREKTAAAFFVFGAWLKVWPAAFVASLFIFVKQKAAVIRTALVLAVAILAAPIILTGNFSALSFIASQTGRGLQIESVAATWFLWLAKFGDGSYGIYYDEKMVTNQVFGPDIGVIAQVLNPLLLVAVVALVLLGMRAAQRTENTNELLFVVWLTITVALIVFNKVGSPQFIGWIVVPVLGLILIGSKLVRVATGFVFALAALTNLVYPIWYLDLMSLGLTSLTLLTVRNVLLIVFFAWLLFRLVIMTRAVR